MKELLRSSEGSAQIDKPNRRSGLASFFKNRELLGYRLGFLRFLAHRFLPCAVRTTPSMSCLEESRPKTKLSYPTERSATRGESRRP